MRFHHRISENVHVFGERQQDGEWCISVVDAVQRPIRSAKVRASAIVAALADQSALRAALWNELPPEVQEKMRGKR